MCTILTCIDVEWSRWRDLSGVIYDKKVPMKLISKLYKTVVRPETIRGIARVTPIKSVLTQKRLSWYGYVMRGEDTHIKRSTLSVTMIGTRPRGRPKMRWLDRLKSDMRIYGINPEMATDRDRWAVVVKNVDST